MCNMKSLVMFWRQVPKYIKCKGKKYRNLFCKHIREFLLKVPWTPGTASLEPSTLAPQTLSMPPIIL